MKHVRGWFWGTAAAVAVADLITKHVVFLHLPAKTSPAIKVISGFFHIVHGENRGGVFGVGQGAGALWLVFGSLAGVLVIWFAHRKDTQVLLLQIALGLVLGGAVGNLYDRATFQFVRDFIQIYYWPGEDWPAFNVADSGICVGAAGLAVYAFFFAPKDEKKNSPRKAH